jgi:hypothetical protein
MKLFGRYLDCTPEDVVARLPMVHRPEVDFLAQMSDTDLCFDMWFSGKNEAHKHTYNVEHPPKLTEA